MSIKQKHCDDCCKDAESRFAEMSKGVSIEGRDDWSDICPKCYQCFDLEKAPKAISDAYYRVIHWNPNSTRGIGLMGASKTGKTFLVYELLRRLHEAGKSICDTTGTELAWAIASPDQSDRRELIERLVKADIAFIDDLGKEKITNTVEADLYHIVEQRRRNLKPLFVTVNSSGDELAERMSRDCGEAFINRLREDVCDFIKVG